jgi:hypothetical protein
MTLDNTTPSVKRDGKGGLGGGPGTEQGIMTLRIESLAAFCHAHSPDEAGLPAGGHGVAARAATGAAEANTQAADRSAGVLSRINGERHAGVGSTVAKIVEVERAVAKAPLAAAIVGGLLGWGGGGQYKSGLLWRGGNDKRPCPYFCSAGGKDTHAMGAVVAGAP